MSPDDGSTGGEADPSSRLDELERRLSELEQAKEPPERGDDSRKIDAAIEARIARMVMQCGPGINVTGGNGNWTFALDASALSMKGNGVCNADGTSTFTFTLTL